MIISSDSNNHVLYSVACGFTIIKDLTPKLTKTGGWDHHSDCWKELLASKYKELTHFFEGIFPKCVANKIKGFEGWLKIVTNCQPVI